MSYYRPIFVSERERAELWVDGKQMDDARWEDCAPTSMLMLVNAATGRKKPTTMTLDEAERLRMAAGYGPTGPTNIVRLGAAAATRYGITAPRMVSGASYIWAALVSGRGAAINGSMGAFPDGHRLRRWAPNFEGWHSVYVQREDESERVRWFDPLAPQGTYAGEWVTRAELRQFFSMGLASAAIRPLVKVP